MAGQPGGVSKGRCMYFEIVNSRVFSDDYGHQVNFSPFDKAMELIEGPLHKLYGDKMSTEVVLITPYLRQHDAYSLAFQALREDGWTDEMLPVLYMADKVSGREFEHVLVDVVVTEERHMGADPMRRAKSNEVCRVLFTRPRNALWIVGGEFKETSTTYSLGKTDSEGNRLPDLAIVYYHNGFKSDGGEATPHDEYDVPIDFYDKYSRVAFDDLAKTSDIKIDRVGRPSLTGTQKSTIKLEAERLKQEAAVKAE